MHCCNRPCLLKIAVAVLLPPSAVRRPLNAHRAVATERCDRQGIPAARLPSKDAADCGQPPLRGDAHLFRPRLTKRPEQTELRHPNNRRATSKVRVALHGTREPMAASNSGNRCVLAEEPLRAASKAGSRSGGPANPRGRTIGSADHSGVSADHGVRAPNRKPSWHFLHRSKPQWSWSCTLTYLTSH
jgi:hypothetical protein